MPTLDTLMHDVSYTLRQLRRSPGFTLVAVASLALGIGANTAIFELVEAIRLRRLPVKDPQTLANLEFAPKSSKSGWFSTRSAELTFSQWDEIRRQQEAFQPVMAWSAARFNLAPGGEVRWAEGLYVSGDFFNVLGVAPHLGRTLTLEDDTAACSDPGAVISYSFWQGEFGGDRNVIGRKVTLDGHALPVVGVTPPAFFGVEVGRQYDVAIPLCADRVLSEDQKGRIPVRHAWWLSMMGRLKPGWTLQKADAHLKTISRPIMQASLPPVYKPDQVKRYLENKLAAIPGATGVSNLREDAERPLWLLLATTGLVLLIACANLANLLLARASVRERELAVRLAIGASRWRLIRQLLVESFALAAAGALIGAVLAQTLSKGLVAFMTNENERLFLTVGLNWTVLGFTAGLAVLTCLLFGLLPAFRATSLAPAAVIRSGGRSITAGPERFSLRRLLVATQVAFSLVLLVGALLFARSLQKLVATEPGFRAEGVIVLSTDISRTQVPQERRQELYRELLSRLKTQPGVVAVAQTWIAPISGSGWNNEIGPDNTAAASSGKLSWFNSVGPGYFQTLGTQLIAGRDFDDRDTINSPRVAVVNEEFARKFFGTTNVVGRTFHMEAQAGKPEPVYQIAGVVKNTKYYDLREDARAIGFVAVTQDKEPRAGTSYVVRIQGSPSQVINAIKGAVAQVNRSIDVEFRMLSTQVKDSLLRERIMATLSGGFALLAGLLAMLGLYGVVAYMVTRRRNEIGVRIALGADKGRVIRLVLRETAILLAFGLGVGIVFSVWMGRAATSLLFGVKPWDPLSLGASIAVLGAVGFLASYGPARRAAALQPMMSLRDE